MTVYNKVILKNKPNIKRFYGNYGQNLIADNLL